MESIWSKSISLKKHSPLKGDISTNTVVIGGGITGLLTAYRLKEKGIKCVVIEAETICNKQTKNTTAKITSQHGVLYSKIRSFYGEEAAKEYAYENQKAIEDYKNLIEKHHISCCFEKKKAVLYSLKDAGVIEKEADAAKKAGIECYLTHKTELPFPVKSALVFENQAQFNPLAFLSAISEELEIYENTKALKVENNIVYTDKGNISAQNIVFSCHFPFVNFPGLYFLRLNQERSYAVSSKWNKELKGMYIDAANGFSFRAYKNNIIIGGGASRTGKMEGQNPFELIEKKGKMWFQDFKTEYQWSAQDCISLDGIPYIGRFIQANPNIFVATGFNKWGMTSAMVSANLISDMVCGIKNYENSIFSPSRFSIFASLKNICTNTVQTVKGFSKYLDYSNLKAKDIKQETAGIIKYKGEKCGAYRCKDGNLYIVSLKCPHLKCILNWNAATKTWDCPCHGSRYDYKGNLLDNPAQENSILIARI
ncbi:MAG: FAD-dependent oxidoreductase [Clostridiales bacterium]|nr:FAD-dependent oxidoreductase [Clostridiales bacterium]